ncbi:MAG: hypothetical protein H8E44_28430 [Planctomycetes bacterium]|nr:hypothetical protein [Planctomycetota bacterium]
MQVADLPPAVRRERYERELETQRYYQRRNEQAHKSHTKTRLKQLRESGIDVTALNSCMSVTCFPHASFREVGISWKLG